MAEFRKSSGVRTPANIPAAGVSAAPGSTVRVGAAHDGAVHDGERVECIVREMTLEEKLACLSTDPSVPRLGIKGSRHVEGLHGLALGGPGKWGGDHPIPTTTFPQAIGLARTWEPELVRRAAEVESIEARYAFHHLGRGALVVRAPNADLGRDPRWGRTEECYGEDPYLAGTLAAAFVRGLQGDDPSSFRTAALLKHFVANSTEDGREDTSAEIDARQLREYYARAFERAVKEGGARSFMAAYNAVNGVPCTVHELIALTKHEWGVDGAVCTDAHALGMLVTKHGYFDDVAVAAAASVKAGITQFLDEYAGPVRDALERGLLTEAELDPAVTANLRTMDRLGLLYADEPSVYATVDASRGHPWQWDEHRLLVREVTEQSVVLLKNEPPANGAGSNGDGSNAAGTNGAGSGGDDSRRARVTKRTLLPLDLAQVRSVAVVGPLADRVLADWYAGTPPYWVSPLEGLRARLAGTNVEVIAAVGNDTSEALLAARRADVCLVCVGNHPTGDAGWAQVTRASYGKEAIDRKSLTLEEEDLVKQVHGVNPRTVLVLLASFPYAIAWSNEHVPAIVTLTHGSQELGHALARVLVGDVNPAGRLAETWPRSLDDVPPLADFDLTLGRTYLYQKAEPLYPFGHGLSYTQFAYGNLQTSRADFTLGAPLQISVDVTNTGERDGEEVVQLYVARPESKIPRPLRELKGYQRVRIESGKTELVTLSLDAKELEHWDPARGAWQLEAGAVVLSVGGSSADIRCTKSVTLVT